MAEKKTVQTRKTTGSKSGKRKTTAAKASQSNVNIAAMVKKLTEPLVFGLDIGTRSIVGTVGYRTSTNGFVVVAQESVEHETRAMLDGQIHDIQAVADTIIQVKQKLEQLIGRKLTDVCIAAAGRVLKTVVACAEMHFNYETVVTNEHVYSLDMLGVEKAYDLLRQEQQNDDIHFYCVGYSVIRYYQNDYPITNLEGHKANTIRTELIATFLPDEVVDGLYAAVEKAGLYVANLTLEPIAAMNVAIPEKFRLLNIALVDVGAGTSDISITNDGSIIAYGMIPSAGDEITEALARHYLLDFGEAEKMKCQSTMRKQVTVHDIMGLSHKISSEEIAEVAEPVVREITTRVADRIKELNGGKPVSAVFVVGGGGKMMGFEETLADNLGIPKERVALRGSEVMGQIEFLQKNIKVDSLLVTPVGICLNYYEQKNNFIFVTLNGERIKLYDNSKLTVVDAAMQMGYPNEDLFPKRGKALNYSVNGEKRMKRGEPGDSAVVNLNGKESALSGALSQNDKIEIKASTAGKDAVMTIGEIQEYHSAIHFIFNRKPITCPRFVQVNGELVSQYYEIQENDEIEILEYYTLEQVLEFMDIVCRGRAYVNNASADMETKVYDNFTIACEIKKEEPNYQELIKEYGEGQVPEAVLNGEMQEAEQVAEGHITEKDMESGEISSQRQDAEDAKTDDSISGNVTEDIPKVKGTSDHQTAEGALESQQPVSGLQKTSPEGVELPITVNGDPVVLKNKKEYILVDVLDFYPFDLSVAKGNRLETLINGVSSDFTSPVHENDEVKIYWV
ncbi:cell division FtsA domain-containing protein [Jutongia sp.]|uniref:cell division FtsA domain-containing protein n=1 Tax=Jutongia sp. TaxID=2944204 RepID=UPI003078F3F2